MSRPIVGAWLPTLRCEFDGALRFYNRSTHFCKNAFMPNDYPLALQQADQARTDFALIEGNLEFIMGQLSRLPTRGDLAKAVLTSVFCTAVFHNALVWVAWY